MASSKFNKNEWVKVGDVYIHESEYITIGTMQAIYLFINLFTFIIEKIIKIKNKLGGLI